MPRERRRPGIHQRLHCLAFQSSWATALCWPGTGSSPRWAMDAPMDCPSTRTPLEHWRSGPPPLPTPPPLINEGDWGRERRGQVRMGDGRPGGRAFGALGSGVPAVGGEGLVVRKNGGKGGEWRFLGGLGRSHDLRAEDADQAADSARVATETISLGSERRFQVGGHRAALRPRFFAGQIARGRVHGAGRGGVGVGRSIGRLTRKPCPEPCPELSRSDPG